MTTVPASLTEPGTGPRRSARGFGHDSIHNESVEWYTPPALFEALGVEFDLDPCSPGEGLSFVPARKHLTIVDDGLATPWDPEAFVFVNPPYGTQTPKWISKLADHGNGIALVFARTDNRWFQTYAAQCSLVCFIFDRIYFYQGSVDNPGGRPGAGSMLLGFGPRAASVLREANLGVCMVPEQMPAGGPRLLPH